MRKILKASLALAAVAAAGSLLAAATVGVDTSSAVTLEGPVVAFTGGLGAGLPVLTVDDDALGVTEVRLGPFWFLTDAGFTAATGDLVRLTAYPCALCKADWVAATAENLTTGSTVALRGDDGLPLWTGALGQGPGPGPGVGAPGPHGRGAGPAAGAPPHGAHHRGFGPCGGAAPSLGAAMTVTGTVVSFTGEPGIHFPTLTLDVDGEELTLAAGPYRVWIAAGFEPAAGQELTVTYAPAVFAGGEEHLVILAVTDPASGLTLIVRDAETGQPGFGCCRRSG